MRVVIDTNIIISALFFGGLPDNFLKLVFEGKIKAVASAEIISEYTETDLEFAKKQTVVFKVKPCRRFFIRLK